MKEITEETYVEDIVRERPDLVGLLARLGIVCQKCSDPFWGTIGELCRMKNLDAEEIITRINTEGNDGEKDA